jgi:hypothetical protein
MILLISEEKSVRIYPNIDRIYSCLTNLDISCLRDIDDIIFMDIRGCYKIKDFTTFTPEFEEIGQEFPGTSKYLENKEKENILLKLFHKIKIVPPSYLDQNKLPDDIKSKEVCFYHPLFNSNLIKALKSVPLNNRNCYINMCSSSSKARKGVIKIEYIDDFMDIVYAMESISKEYVFWDELGDPYEIINSSTEKVGYYFSQKIPRSSLKENIYKYFFIGNYEHYFKYVAEYLYSNQPNVFHYDLTCGLPRFIKPGYSLLMFYNIDFLSQHEQAELWAIINDYHYSESKIFIQGNEDKLIPELSGKFTKVRIPSLKSLKNNLTDIFLSMLNEYSNLIDGDSFSRELVRHNVFLPLLEKINDITHISRFLNTIETNNDGIFEVGFWYNFNLENRNFQSENSLVSYVKPKIKKNQCYIICRGDYWLLSYNYDLPLIMDQQPGLFFIAGLMLKSGTPFDAYDIRAKFSDKIKKDSLHARKVRDAIRETIDDIKRWETKLLLGDKLSTYLSESFIPKEKGSQSVFSDTYGTCLYILPSKPKINWKIFTPIEF